MNLLLSTDSYKSSHFLQYPPGMDGLHSYFESRGGKYDRTVFFGLQILIEQYLRNPITKADIDEAESIFVPHGLPFNRAGWEHILNVHEGFMPVVIRAPQEGSVIPNHNVLMTVESTCPDCAWIVNYLETLLVRLWYPITVATLSFHAKKSILDMLYQTADDPQAEINFKLHDFGARGVSSSESAAIGGAAHLVNFMGSDTIEGIVLANRIYKSKMAAFSIPATEHSTITSWGRNGEKEAFANMIDKFGKPGALFACVSDSYDLWNAIDNLWGGELRQKVKECGATLVVRPDSGHPATIVRECLERLDAKFGSTRNTLGYKVLNNVRVIQGDGITPDSITEILANAARAGYSATNVAFGMGGGLLQQVNRDTQRFAYKASAIHFANRGWVGINKNPITDPGKASKSGRLNLIWTGKEYVTQPMNAPWGDFDTTALQTVYCNGIIPKGPTLDDIRTRANAALDKIVYKGGRG